jgi:hypothetical protein
VATGDASRPAGRSFKEEHVGRYQATNGEDGYLWNGAPVLLITTTDTDTVAELNSGD